MDRETHRYLICALCLESFEFLGISSVSNPRDLFDYQVPVTFGTTCTLLLPANALAILLEINMLVLGRTHRTVL